MTTTMDSVEVRDANGHTVLVPLTAAVDPAPAEDTTQDVGPRRVEQRKKRTPKHILGDTKVEKVVVVIIGLLMLTLAGAGMFVSFTTVQINLEPWFPGHYRSAVVPLGVDTGILLFGMVDILLAYWDMPYPLPRLFEWGLVGATAWLNVAGPEPAWVKAAHIVMPSLWAVSVQVVRKVILTRLGLIDGTKMARIRFARWILAPRSTWTLWRRMVLWEITNYSQALEMEFNRLATQATAKQHWGENWKKVLPGDLVLKIEMGLVRSGDIPLPPVPAGTKPGVGDEAGDERVEGVGDEAGDETVPGTRPGAGDGDEKPRRSGTKSRFGTGRPHRPRVAGHVAGAAAISDEHKEIVARVAKEMVAKGERVNTDNLAPRLRALGIRQRNGQWGPYVEAAKQAASS
jgi:hypothetical protein